MHILLRDLPEQAIAVVVAFVLCSLLGWERSYHHKDAGLKTHVLVGLGACVFTLVSAYGFAPSITPETPFDPSRVAAQVVSGVGFLGAGVIFVNNDTVRGLTTAATVWISAAVGVACGASLIPLACLVLVLHYALVFALGPLSARMSGPEPAKHLFIEYMAGQGVMRKIMLVATKLGYKSTALRSWSITVDNQPAMRVEMRFEGTGSLRALSDELTAISGLFAIASPSDSKLE